MKLWMEPEHHQTEQLFIKLAFIVYCLLFIYYVIDELQFIIIAVMIRRKSTLDLAERQKRTKYVQIFGILDLCLQIPSDDRLLIRNQVKEGDQQLFQRIYQCKKDKNFHSLQIYLRKKIQKLKQADKFGLGLTRNQSRAKNMKSKNVTQNSYHNSVQNSINSSPSAKKSAKTSITRHEVERHIQNEIDRQIMHGIKRQECELQQRDITPRQIQIQVKPIQSDYLKPSSSALSQPQFNIKAILKTKINEKACSNSTVTTVANRTSLLEKHSSYVMNKQNIKIERRQDKIRQTVQLVRNKNLLTLNKNEQNCPKKQKQKQKQVKIGQHQLKYGQFYKRIRQVIDQAY